MGKDKAQIKKDNSIWGCHGNTSYSCNCSCEAFRQAIKLKRETKLREKPITLAGIDLAASRGINAIILGKLKDKELYIIDAREYTNITLLAMNLFTHSPLIIAVDAPLCTPYHGFRLVEKTIVKTFGGKFLPGGFSGMRQLTIVGHSLCWLGNESSILILETHPGSIRKFCDIKLEIKQSWSKDLDDAYLSLLTAWSFVEEKYIAFVKDAPLIFPSCEFINTIHKDKLVKIGNWKKITL